MSARIEEHLVGLALSRQEGHGVDFGFDCVHQARGSVPVQARDHRKRRSNLISAENTQRDYALAA